MAAVVSLIWFFVAVWLVLPVTFVSEVVLPSRMGWIDELCGEAHDFAHNHRCGHSGVLFGNVVTEKS